MTSWQRRIQRAEELAEESPVYPELLHFYREIAHFQAAVAEGPPPANLDALLALARRDAPDPMHAFFARVLLQADAGSRAPQIPVTTGVQRLCPCCGEKPVAAVLRTESDVKKRFLLCGICFTEWEFRGLLCPHCGEEDKDKLTFYTAAEMPHVRVEACDTCRVYIKSVDVTKDTLAVPEVDELAAVVLDLWATGHGYTKLQANLFGM
jgi:formate dehydrogenase accessory protein FdhE